QVPGLVVIEVAPEMVAQYNIWLGNHVLPRLTWRNLGLYGGDLMRDSSHVTELAKDRLIPVYRCRQQIRTELMTALQESPAPPIPETQTTASGVATSAGEEPASSAQELADRFLETDQSVAFQER